MGLARVYFTWEVGIAAPALFNFGDLEARFGDLWVHYPTAAGWNCLPSFDDLYVSPEWTRNIVEMIMAFSGEFTPVPAKHSKSISVGVDRMQSNFEPTRKQVESWQRSELTDVTAKVVIYEAFVEGKLEAPKHLARTVLDLYFEPKYEEFRSRTIWSLSNAFTSALTDLEPIPQFRVTAKLSEFLEERFPQSF